MKKRKMGVVYARKLSKTFKDGDLEVQVLKDIQLDVQPGKKVAIIGTSGSGKSTLLHLLGGLDLPSRGDVWIKGHKMSAMSDKKRGDIRNKSLGFIYQFHHLLPEFSSLDNVAMPLYIRGVEKQKARAKARELLKEIGLRDRLRHRPAELSGGERQRTAIARALITKPACIFADEPTGNLDDNTAQTVFSMMMDLNYYSNSAIVMVTHDIRLAKKMDACYHLIDGVLTKC